MGGAEPHFYHREMTRLFECLAPHARTIVACDPKDPDLLVGFVCFSGACLHYVYVAHDFRELGLVPLMLAGVEIKRYTFKTRKGLLRLKPKERSWVFTPRFTL